MSDETKKEGVDLIKKAIKFTYDLTTESIEVLKDKKVSLAEVIGLGDNLYSGVTIALKSGELWAQLKGLDTEEGVDLALYVGDLIKGATKEDVDIIIDNAIEVVKKEIEIYHDHIHPIVKIIKKTNK